jgi:hypothetical protein
MQFPKSLKGLLNVLLKSLPVYTFLKVFCQKWANIFSNAQHKKPLFTCHPLVELLVGLDGDGTEGPVLLAKLLQRVLNTRTQS